MSCASQRFLLAERTARTSEALAIACSPALSSQALLNSASNLAALRYERVRLVPGCRRSIVDHHQLEPNLGPKEGQSNPPCSDDWIRGTLPDERLLMALSGRSADRVARSGSGRKADMCAMSADDPKQTFSGRREGYTGIPPTVTGSDGLVVNRWTPYLWA